MGIKLKLEFDCNNSSFEGDEFMIEIARVIQRTSEKIVMLYYNSRNCDSKFYKKLNFQLQDKNGNSIGQLKVMKTRKVKEKK